MSVHSLIILPNDPLADPPETGAFQRHLSRIGLTGEACDFLGQKAFRTGTAFEKWIRFSDDHPKEFPARDQGVLIPAGAAGGLDECHVQIHDYSPRIEALLGGDIINPSCPACGYILTEWGDMIADWFGDRRRYRWPCRHCSAMHLPWNLDWHRTCGFGRFFLEIRNVDYKEAEPADKFLESLKSAFGISWTYFFYHF